VTPTGPQPSGEGCEEINYKGKCSFESVSQYGQPNSDGTIPLLVRHTADSIGMSLRTHIIHARRQDQPAIDAFYQQNSPVDCEAHIITPPCNERTDVTLKLGPPPVGKIIPNAL